MPGAGSINVGVGDFGLNLFQGPTTEATEVSGTILTAVDPFWGGLEFMYVKAGGTINKQAVVVVMPTLVNGKFEYVATEVPNTANLGRTLGVATYAMATNEYGWIAVGGLTVAAASASVAVDTSVGITAAGKVGAVAAGKQVLNARCAGPSTTAFAKTNCQATSGSKTLNVPNTDGWFVGIILSGTGIAAGTTVTNIDPSGRRVTLSANTTAAVNGTVTGTYNDGAFAHYLLLHINRPFAQGAIT